MKLATERPAIGFSDPTRWGDVSAAVARTVAFVAEETGALAIEEYSCSEGGEREGGARHVQDESVSSDSTTAPMAAPSAAPTNRDSLSSGEPRPGAVFVGPRGAPTARDQEPLRRTQRPLKRSLESSTPTHQHRPLAVPPAVSPTCTAAAPPVVPLAPSAAPVVPPAPPAPPTVLPEPPAPPAVPATAPPLVPHAHLAPSVVPLAPPAPPVVPPAPPAPPTVLPEPRPHPPSRPRPRPSSRMRIWPRPSSHWHPGPARRPAGTTGAAYRPVGTPGPALHPTFGPARRPAGTPGPAGRPAGTTRPARRPAGTPGPARRSALGPGFQPRTSRRTPAAGNCEPPSAATLRSKALEHPEARIRVRPTIVAARLGVVVRDAEEDWDQVGSKEGSCWRRCEAVGLSVCAEQKSVQFASSLRAVRDRMRTRAQEDAAPARTVAFVAEETGALAIEEYSCSEGGEREGGARHVQDESVSSDSTTAPMAAPSAAPTNRDSLSSGEPRPGAVFVGPRGAPHRSRSGAAQADAEAPQAIPSSPAPLRTSTAPFAVPPAVSPTCTAAAPPVVPLAPSAAPVVPPAPPAPPTVLPEPPAPPAVPATAPPLVPHAHLAPSVVPLAPPAPPVVPPAPPAPPTVLPEPPAPPAVPATAPPLVPHAHLAPSIVPLAPPAPPVVPPAPPAPPTVLSAPRAPPFIPLSAPPAVPPAPPAPQAVPPAPPALPAVPLAPPAPPVVPPSAPGAGLGGSRHPRVAAPKVYSSRGLARLTDPVSTGDSNYLVELGVRCSLMQLLDCGFFHADPHPGNLLRTEDGKLAYLDFGMMIELEGRHRTALIKAVVHLVNRENAVKDGVAELNFQNLSDDLAGVMYEFPFKIPPFYSLVIRSLTVLEGIALSSNPEFKVLARAYPYIVKQLMTANQEELKESLKELLLADGRIRWESLKELLLADGRIRWRRLESLVRKASEGAAPVARPAPGADPDAKRGETTAEIFEFVFSDGGTFIRDVVVDEVVRAVENAAEALAAEAAQTFWGGRPPAPPGPGSMPWSRLRDEDREALESIGRLLQSASKAGQRVDVERLAAVVGPRLLPEGERLFGRLAERAAARALRQVMAALDPETFGRAPGPGPASASEAREAYREAERELDRRDAEAAARARQQ
eukprot:tig00020660_g12510.t1